MPRQPRPEACAASTVAKVGMIPATPGTGTRPAMKTAESTSATESTRLAAAREQAHALLPAGDDNARAALARGFLVATLAASLGSDPDMIVGAMIAPLLAGGDLSHEQASKSFGGASFTNMS